MPDAWAEIEEGERYLTMLHRHGEAVLRVLGDAYRSHADRLARAELPRTSLLALMPEEPEDGHQPDPFVPSAGYRSVSWRGITYALTPSQAVIVRNLHAARRAHIDALSAPETLAGTNQRSVAGAFTGSPLWKTLVTTRRRGFYSLAI